MMLSIVYNHLWALGGGGGYSKKILGGGGPPGSPIPDPISDQKMSFFTPVFRPGLALKYIPIFRPNL